MKDLSKYIAFLLRHHPEEKNLKMDNQGFIKVNDLIKAINCTKEELIEIVETDNKKRYEFNIEGTKIRAVQGHSIKGLDIGLTELEPPKILYHGTATRFIDSIKKSGLKPQTRHHVHLSLTKDIATLVGKRHGKLIILTIDSNKMFNDGYKFYISKNNVWLTDEVPVKYIKELKKDR